MDNIKIINRKTKEINENKESKITLFLYKTILGRILLKILASSIISKLAGKFLDSKISSKIIPKFVKSFKVDMKDYEEREYISFNDFFTRKTKEKARKIPKAEKNLMSPCDAKLSVYKINKESQFKIKNSYYSVNDLIDSKLGNEFINGHILIFRLDVDDYHRYCYIDDGYKSKNYYIKGVFHTVRPIALSKYNIYKTNTRQWTLLHTKNFGDVIQVEVGAMLVGKIVNHHHNSKFNRGEEKGYFEYGGSTVVLLFKENSIKIDKDLLENTEKNLETIVKLGEKIGKKYSLNRS